MKILKKCRICQKDQFFPVLRYFMIGSDGVYKSIKKKSDDFHKSPITLLRCKSCSFLQLKEIVTDSLYKEYTFSSENAQLIRKWQKNIAEGIIKNYHLKSDNILEIGSGDGSFLSYFQSNHILGIEPSEKLAIYANSRGIPTVNMYFNKKTAGSLKNKFKAIFIRHVLEHIDDIRNFIYEAIKLLDHNGFVYIESPYAPHIIKTNNYSNIFYEHLNYFTLSDIIRLFSEYGFYLGEYGFNQIHNRSFYAIFSVFGHPKNNKTDNLSSSEIKSFKESFSRFQKTWDEIFLITNGKKTAGYGAANKTFTILNIGRFQKNKIIEIYDRNINLHQKIIPYFNIPIRDPSSIIKTHPEYIIIFATAYQREIIADLYNLNYRGKAILFYPELKIIDFAKREKYEELYTKQTQVCNSSFSV